MCILLYRYPKRKGRNKPWRCPGTPSNTAAIISNESKARATATLAVGLSTGGHPDLLVASADVGLPHCFEGSPICNASRPDQSRSPRGKPNCGAIGYYPPKLATGEEDCHSESLTKPPKHPGGALPLSAPELTGGGQGWIHQLAPPACAPLQMTWSMSPCHWNPFYHFPLPPVVQDLRLLKAGAEERHSGPSVGRPGLWPCGGCVKGCITADTFGSKQRVSVKSSSPGDQGWLITDTERERINKCAFGAVEILPDTPKYGWLSTKVAHAARGTDSPSDR